MRVSRTLRVALITMCCGAWVGEAGACRICDPFLHCIDEQYGARVCLESPLACALVVPCMMGPVRDEAGGESGLTVWTLYDATTPSGTSLQVEAGPLAVGEEARMLSAGRSATGAIADLAIAFGEDFEVRFVTEFGDGFALRREVQGERVRLEVRELTGESVGRLLASESLAARDQLSVPVRVDGRERVLLLQTANQPAAKGKSEIARLRQALRVAGTTLAPRERPLLEARAH